MAVISGGVSLNGNASLSGSIQLNSGNNRSSSTTIDRQQAQSIIILPSSNSYRQIMIVGIIPINNNQITIITQILITQIIKLLKLKNKNYGMLF